MKKREDELSLSLQMEDWKLDAVLIYVCFTHSLLKFFPPFVINKIYIVCWNTVPFAELEVMVKLRYESKTFCEKLTEQV